jgi:ribosomal-protein-alanine N-acetyltransferase
LFQHDSSLQKEFPSTNDFIHYFATNRDKTEKNRKNAMKKAEGEYNENMKSDLFHAGQKQSLLLNYTLKEASIRDLGALRHLEQVCFGDDAWGLLDLIAVLTLPDVIRIKAVAPDERMIGFIAGDPRPGQGFSWIATVGVLPEWRGQGIGRTLITACEARITTPRIRLTVRRDNHIAIRLYESLGYRTINLLPNYYRDGTAALVMEKENPHAVKGV